MTRSSNTTARVTASPTREIWKSSTATWKLLVNWPDKFRFVATGRTEVKFSATFCSYLSTIFTMSRGRNPPLRGSENWIYSRIDKPSHKSVHYRPVKFSMRTVGSIVLADCARLSTNVIPTQCPKTSALSLDNGSFVDLLQVHHSMMTIPRWKISSGIWTRDLKVLVFK